MPLTIPADVPVYLRQQYRKNYTLLTRGTGNLFMFAADHKIEHLDKDFHGPHIDPAAHDPRHLFSIGSKGQVGCMATQLGLIARYGNQFSDIPYVAKLNAKTNIIPHHQQDPSSRLLWTVNDVLTLEQLTIPGIGVTVYLGSEYEHSMLVQAAQEIFTAHQNGLIAILWIYPRGKAVKNEADPHLIAGAVGVAASLGADFVKIHAPEQSDAATLKFIAEAAGNTKVIIAGGAYKEEQHLLKEVTSQIKAGIAGAAIGRSLFQHSLEDAVKLSKKLSSIIYE